MPDRPDARNERIEEASHTGRVNPRDDVSLTDLRSEDEIREQNAGYDRLNHVNLSDAPETSFGVGDNPGAGDLAAAHDRADLNIDAGVPNDLDEDEVEAAKESVRSGGAAGGQPM